MFPQLTKKISIYRTRRFILEELNSQRQLMRTGVSAFAKVVHIEKELILYRGYVRLKIWVIIKGNSTVIYRHMQTLVKQSATPKPGGVISVRYCPHDLSRVVII